VPWSLFDNVKDHLAFALQYERASGSQKTPLHYLDSDAGLELGIDSNSHWLNIGMLPLVTFRDASRLVP
jgi:hypothetical protein